MSKRIGILLTGGPIFLAAILANKTVKMMLMNNARSLMFTGVPSFPMLASIRAAYGLLKSGQTIEASRHSTPLVRYLLVNQANEK